MNGDLQKGVAAAMQSLKLAGGSHGFTAAGIHHAGIFSAETVQTEADEKGVHTTITTSVLTDGNISGLNLGDLVEKDDGNRYVVYQVPVRVANGWRVWLRRLRNFTLS